MPVRVPSLRWLVLLAVVLRLAFVAHHASRGWQLQYDAGYYLTLAQHLSHGVYSLYHPLDIPDTTRMPGYPWLIHLLGSSVPAVLLLQVLLSAANVVLVHRLAAAIGLPPRGAWLAAVLMALEPMAIVLSGSLLTETCFTTALLGGTLLLLQRPPTWRTLVGAALCFAMAAWLRANGLLLGLAAVGIATVVLRLPVQKGLVCAAMTVLLVTPWVLRNHASTGRWMLSDSGPVAAAHFHLPEVLAAAHDPHARTYRQELHERAARTDWEDRTAAATYFDGLRKDLRHIFLAHPLAWSAVQLRTAVGILVAPGRGHIANHFGMGPLAKAVSGWSMLYSVLLVCTILICLLRWRRLPVDVVVLLLLAGAIIWSGGISTTDTRFKAPGMPLLLVCAAWAVTAIGSARFAIKGGTPGPVPNPARPR
ncbi:MAG: hypothetical protein R2817_12305 [Flavobacteriales bacterium]